MFWDNVKSELDYLGITQKELSAKAGINIGTLKNQICRNVMPNIEDACKIATALNTSAEYLLYGSASDKYSSEEKSLINSYRTLNQEQKKLVTMLLNNLNGVVPEILPGEDNFIVEIK